ncbi:XAC2610-related protein [Chryseobacterium polytrichastri]|uniref:Uncharacterized protein n=1 Tax=Chryseobacterium polytrichastri TaxID=1302687 RepID=A0A1M7JNY2_9FLAO|nr:hypothetical protein [Chryseobacterium polytrichastri]SHM54696.1 hypothetical protein SAMN05444267_10542 [Chryseobacterium polytrichastri]
MRYKLKTVVYSILSITTINSCQSKENNEKVKLVESHETPFLGKWQSIRKNDKKYYLCTDDDNFLTVNKNNISNHTPMEDSKFHIHHTKKIGERIYLYFDKEESNHYIFSWVDKVKGIASWKLNNYDANLFINEKQIKAVENKKCESNEMSCKLNDLSTKFNFKIEASDYSDEKNKKYPITAWIIIINKNKDSKPQEIHFEPNSWSTYSNLPCDNFIVKDYNFDGLEDFAFVWDSGSSAGKLYEYYFQDKNEKFNLADSFPLQHGLLAKELSIEEKTIKISNSVGCCSLNISTFKLKSDGIWETFTEQKKINK